MNKKKITIIISSVISLILIITAIVLVCIDSSPKDEPIAEEVTVPKEELPEESSIDETILKEEKKEEKPPLVTYDTVDAKKLPDYKKAYPEYIKKHEKYFSRGMLLCDLNNDKIPELFSLEYTTKGDRLCYHQLTENGVKEPESVPIETYIDISNLAYPVTYFEDTYSFFGVYKNKSTGEKALINSNMYHGSDAENLFDIITYSDGKPTLKRNAATITSQEFTYDSDIRDKIMYEYEVADGELFSSFLLRGEFGGEYGSDPVEAIKELIKKFNGPKPSIKYNKAKDGELKCYIRNINPSKNEIELIPITEITYDEYQRMIKTGEPFTVEDKQLVLISDPHNELDYTTIAQPSGDEYYFFPPDENSPVSIIDGYTGRTPVKVKIKNDLIIKYQSGNGTKEYTIEEYASNYIARRMLSYNLAVIKNNELVSLDVLYHP